jgi:hypothetical protein
MNEGPGSEGMRREHGAEWGDCLFDGEERRGDANKCIVRESIRKGRRTVIPIGLDAVNSHRTNENDYYIQLTCVSFRFA